jgi:hypothetical protein
VFEYWYELNMLDQMCARGCHLLGGDPNRVKPIARTLMKKTESDQTADSRNVPPEEERHYFKEKYQTSMTTYDARVSVCPMWALANQEFQAKGTQRHEHHMLSSTSDTSL